MVKRPVHPEQPGDFTFEDDKYPRVQVPTTPQYATPVPNEPAREKPWRVVEVHQLADKVDRLREAYRIRQEFAERLYGTVLGFEQESPSYGDLPLERKCSILRHVEAILNQL